MIGIIDVGGGTRDIYGAGVFDYCLEHHITFDYGIGISAGSANLASFTAKQYKRNYHFFMDYAFREEYMSLKNFINKGSYVDLDYIYYTLSRKEGENPLDYETLKNNPMKFNVLAYNANTGEPHVFTKKDINQDEYRIFSASSCLPIVCKPVNIEGVPYYDGGIIEPIPVRRALKDGCDKVVLILTRPIDYMRDSDHDKLNVNILSKIDKKASEHLRKRAEVYNAALKDALELEKQGKVLIVAPDTIGHMSTLSKEKQNLYLLYRKGYNDAEKIARFIRGE